MPEPALATPTPPPPGPAGAAARPRLAALDAARALGVLAMVMGHTLDAVLSPAGRQTPAMVQYWHARGLTAPLFLLVSGWAVTLAISRSGARGWAVPRSRLRRVVLLLVIGYTLRWPGWAQERLLAGDREIWAHFLAFDVLHCIAVVLLVTSLVLALPWRAPIKAAMLAGLAVLAAGLGAGAGTPGQIQGPAHLPHSLLLLGLLQVVGGTSPFPVVPWAAYFFAGTVVGCLRGGVLGSATRRCAAGGEPALSPPVRLPRLLLRPPPGMAMAAVAIVLAAAGLLLGGLGDRPAGDPVLIGFRIGVVLAVLAALELVPASLARRAAPLGKSSLGVYAIHLPIVYGWSFIGGLSWRVGPTLGTAAAVGVAALVLGVSFAAYRGLAAAARRAAARWRGVRILWPA